MAIRLAIERHVQYNTAMSYSNAIMYVYFVGSYIASYYNYTNIHESRHDVDIAIITVAIAVIEICGFAIIAQVGFENMHAGTAETKP